jgi:hypothetical protein
VTKLLASVVMLLAVSTAAASAEKSSHIPPLTDGRWYGKVVAVDVRSRDLLFEPACVLRSNRWTSVERSQRAVHLATGADLVIYFRPGGNAVAGHVQSATLRELMPVALHGRLPDFPSGWFLTVSHGVGGSLQEDSGARSSGEADQRTFACIWSPQTQVFVRVSN